MIKTLVLCDFCEKPLPTQPVLDSEYGAEEVVLHKTKEWDTRLIFPHLCYSCASKLDKALRVVKEDAGYKAQLAAKFAKINAERKERLGTKG